MEVIVADGDVLGYVINNQNFPAKTTFLTPPDSPFQLGYIVYPAGGVVKRHFHKPLVRSIATSSEALIVKKGRCVIDFYNRKLDLVVMRELAAGDVVLIFGGGHGLRMLEDTVILEVKQGPYFDGDKGYF